MTDIRSRHVPWEHQCQDCGKDWPCDAIREADRADDLDNRLIGTVEALTNAEHRAQTAEGLLILARRDLAAEGKRANKAEAALWLRDEAIVVLHEQAHKAEAALAAVQAVLMRLQEFCESSEPGLLDAFWFTEHNRPVSLMEVSIVHTDAAPGEMDEHGAWGFKKAVAYTNVTGEDWVMAEEER